MDIHIWSGWVCSKSSPIRIRFCSAESGWIAIRKPDHVQHWFLNSIFFKRTLFWQCVYVFCHVLFYFMKLQQCLVSKLFKQCFVSIVMLQREQLRTLMTIQGVACVSSNQRPHVIWLTVASQCIQSVRIAKFPTSFSFYSCVIIDENPAFTVHVTAHAFRAAMNLNSMLLRQ